MVIVMKPGTLEQEWKKIKENLEGRGCTAGWKAKYPNAVVRS